MRIEETEVVVVGAGVSGLVMSVEAFRRGFKARILERQTTAAPHAAGAVLQPRALEVLARLEIYDMLRTAGARLERIRFHRAGDSDPALTLEYAGVDSPFPHALAITQEAAEAVLLEQFAKYQALRLERGVELLSLARERGRVAGAVARGPEGDVTYRANVVVVTSSAGGAPTRAEVGAATRQRAYPEEHAALVLPAPEGTPPAIDAWLGPGLMVASYPISARLLRIEATAPTGRLAAAAAAGPDALRRILVAAAPRLEEALKGLARTDDVLVSGTARSHVPHWVGDGVALIGSAAHAMSPCSWNVETQAALDAAALAGVLSKQTLNGDWSGLALAPYEAARRKGAEAAALLAHDLHRAGCAGAGLLARARDAALARLAQSERLRRKLLRTLAGFDDDPFELADRLRLAGILPLSA